MKLPDYINLTTVQGCMMFVDYVHRIADEQRLSRPDVWHAIASNICNGQFVCRFARLQEAKLRKEQAAQVRRLVRTLDSAYRGPGYDH